ncbi:GreA/GreB family elongation factor [Aquimarina intermedia]|uniref:Transcription elongation factor GreB n=1 Tax=Aquimarina intermedia TaxID=350814 RepID=A0A5S5C9X3_9FLAO|nr:GreA/GreB family elongation factor [Aquimarina intermedia]TYP75302.1 transcription elongation factor GreB [Aquimarina intermedia]
MSRAFVKEDDHEEVPIIPPRAHLPEGFVNYVTPVGMELLLTERKTLLAKRASLNIDDEKDRRFAIAMLDGKSQLLNSRIATAKVVHPTTHHTNDTVRFGATITLKIMESGKSEVFRIVGVDEANIAKKKIAYTSPMARILINKSEGDTATLILERGCRVFEIQKITYK